MVCGSFPAMASRRTVSRETPSRWASCAAVRKSGAACSVSGGGGRRGGGMSAAARARATVSSSSGGTAARGGGSVSWWVFTVLGCMDGFLSQGPCPLGDLGGWSRGPICARICPGTLSRRWYANTSRSIGQEGGVGRAAGPFAVPVIAADLQPPTFGSEREPGVGLPRKQGLVQWYGVNRDTLARAPTAAV